MPELRTATSELFAALEGCAERLLTALGSAYALPEDTFSQMLYAEGFAQAARTLEEIER